VTFDNARRAVLTVSAGLLLRGGAGAPLRAPLLAERTKFESDDSPCADLRFRRRGCRENGRGWCVAALFRADRSCGGVGTA
jgi:hypothetical protein